MSFASANKALIDAGFGDRVIVLEASSATVALAAEALHTVPEHIVKTLAFKVDQAVVVIAMAGDAKIDNTRYKHTFGAKAKMLTEDETLALTGHAVGGVCPFGLVPGARVYLDASLKRFASVDLYPACGSGNSAVRLSLEEMIQVLAPVTWVSVTKAWPGAEEEPEPVLVPVQVVES